MTTLHVATANAPGAVAILQLHGPATPRILAELTGHDAWPTHRVRLSRFADIDEGLAVVLDHHTAQLMPHGGPRVVQRLVEHLLALGCTYAPRPDPRVLYPEADSPIEADMLHAIARAASPAAIDLLAAQPERWRALAATPEVERDAHRHRIAERSAVLARLLAPPTVVVAGPANVGKSTLTNALMGRAVSIVADLPGTTRDWVSGLVELVPLMTVFPHDETACPSPEVAVHWLDTPGLRDTGDTVEQRAIMAARSIIDKAEVLIAMRDASNHWPEPGALPRTPGLWVVNKCDEQSATPQPHDGSAPDRPLRISAEHGHGLTMLQHAVLQRLGLGFLNDEEAPWAFSNTLQAWAAGGAVDLDAYLNTVS